jgi:hypothetical protein
MLIFRAGTAFIAIITRWVYAITNSKKEGRK